MEPTQCSFDQNGNRKYTDINGNEVDTSDGCENKDLLCVDPISNRKVNSEGYVVDESNNPTEEKYGKACRGRGIISKFFSTYTYLKFLGILVIATALSSRITFIRPVIFRIFTAFILLSIVYIVFTRYVFNYVKVAWNGVWPLNKFYKFKILGDDILINSADIYLRKDYNGLKFENAIPAVILRQRSMLSPFFENNQLKLNKKFTYGQYVDITIDGKKFFSGILKGVRETKLLFDKKDVDVMTLTDQQPTYDSEGNEIATFLRSAKNIVIRSGKSYKKSLRWQD